MPDATFTCPRCGATSAHPVDVERGYCGACHIFTGSVKPDEAAYLQEYLVAFAENRGATITPELGAKMDELAWTTLSHLPGLMDAVDRDRVASMIDLRRFNEGTGFAFPGDSPTN